MQDSHPTDSPEFRSFPPHCLEGTEEARMCDDLARLPFAQDFVIFPKTSIDSAIGTQFPAWLEAHPRLTRIVVVGDCTDLCVYQLALYLRLQANARRLPLEVVVPASCVATYDLTVADARKLGAKPHDGNLMQRFSLHQMELNGIQVIWELV